MKPQTPGRLALWTLLAILATGLATGPLAVRAEPFPAPGEFDAVQIREALRAGGVTLAFRHAQTNWEEKDTFDRRTHAGGFEDCAKQRNLSPLGKVTSRRIGQSIEKIGVPVGKVMGSPMCRTLETARLAFGRVEKSEDLVGAGDDKKAALQKLLATPPAEGTVRVLVTHGDNLMLVTPYTKKQIAEGHALVVRPAEDGQFEVLANLTPEDWNRVLKTLDQPVPREVTSQEN